MATETRPELDSSQRILAALKEARARLEAAERAASEPIAIVGLGCRFPGGADGPEAYWRLLADGIDAVGPIPPERYDIDALYDPTPATPGKLYVRQGAFLKDIDRFDAAFFDISPREAVSLDPQQRLLLEVAYAALEHAGLAPDRLRGSRSGVFVGIGRNDYSHRLLPAAPESITAWHATGNGLCYGPGRLAHALDLRGPNLVLDTACSSSLVALHLACQSLRRRECDLALAGGCHAHLSPQVAMMLSMSGALAPDGRSKAFDAAADGFGQGEGCGVVVLKRLSDAQAQGDTILALVRGSAVNHDGHSSGLTVPNPVAQAQVIRDALANARVEPREIGYVEAHGTGTPLGDPIEVEALAAVFCAERSRANPLRIGSVKTNLGHLEAAAGIAGLIKVVLALHHGSIPPHLNFHTPNPRIPWHSLPIDIPTRPTAWARGEAARLAGVSSFGMSGSNAHIVLQEAPALAERPALPERPLHLFTLSARSEAALRQQASRLAAHLAERADLPPGDIAHTLNTGRTHFPVRVGLVAGETHELIRALSAVAAGQIQPAVLPEDDGQAAAPGQISAHPAADWPGAAAGLDEWRTRLTDLARRYERGAPIAWATLDRDCPPRRRVPLPTYPFERQRYWCEDLPVAAPTAREIPAYRMVWREASAPQAEEALRGAGRWLIFADGDGLADSLARRLAGRGDDCVFVWAGDAFKHESATRWTVDPNRAADFGRLFRELPEPTRWTGVLCLWSAATGPAAELDGAAQLRTCAGLLHLVQALATREVKDARLWLATRNAVAHGQTDAEPLDLAHATVWGMGKVIALEHPEFWGGMIDLPTRPGEADLTAFLAILAEAGDEDHILLRGGQRLHGRIEPFIEPAAPSARPSVRADATYLITGGLGALGLHLAQWLAGQGARSLVLMGRREPSPTAREAIEALRQAGAAVTVLAADVADAADLERAFATIQSSLPPLRGVFHAAGLPGQQALAELDAEALHAVLRPKVAGGWLLHRLTAPLDLDWFVAFSSVAALWGSKGQAHYAAANYFLDALADHRRQLGLPALSLNWGPWDGGGMAGDEARDWLARVGVRAFAPAEALAAMGRRLGSPHARIGLADVDWGRFRELYEVGRRRPLLAELWPAPSETASAATAVAPLASEFAHLGPAERRDWLVGHLQREVAAIVGLPDGQRPDPRKGFFRLGMDSLMAVELKDRLAKGFRVPLAATVAFDYPNVADLAAHLADKVLDWAQCRSDFSPTPPHASPDRAEARPTDLAIRADCRSGFSPTPPDSTPGRAEARPTEQTSEPPADDLAAKLARLEFLMRET